mgnify:CR=1 FL=1
MLFGFPSPENVRARRRAQPFFEMYKAFPAGFFGRDDIEKGNMILLPPSAARHLTELHIEGPMLFRITNNAIGLSTHCGMLEFTAEEGTVVLPFWLLQHLALREGDDVSIESAILPKGTYVKLQPHKTAFIDLPNPKAVLENALRKYACLTKGDSIVIEFAGNTYEIDIIETKPHEAIMTIQTDLEVDFATPKDYKEEPTLQKEPSWEFREESTPEKQQGNLWGGQGRRLDGRPAQEPPKQEPKEREYDPRKHRLVHGVRKTQSNQPQDYWERFSGGKTLK